MSCKYCFQRNVSDSAPARRAVRPDALASAGTICQFAAFCRQNGIDRVEFFGGEPLLHKDTFLMAANTLVDRVPGIKLGIVTNGTLIDEQIMSLIEREKVSVLLSLDGMRERHNLMRGGFDSIEPWFDRLARNGHTSVAMQVGETKDCSKHVRFIWKQGFTSVYLNVIQNYNWYSVSDADCFEEEYEKAVIAMLAGEGELLCAMSMHQMLNASEYKPMCGVTESGLACDWQGLLYPCHRVPELGADFAVGDIWKGISKSRDQTSRRNIESQCFDSPSARQYNMVSFCPVTVYQKYGNFSGEWSAMFCELISRKAKIVAKYHYEIQDYVLAKHSSACESAYLPDAIV
jgi:uncharacterized protein